MRQDAIDQQVEAKSQRPCAGNNREQRAPPGIPTPAESEPRGENSERERPSHVHDAGIACSELHEPERGHGDRHSEHAGEQE